MFSQKTVSNLPNDTAFSSSFTLQNFSRQKRPQFSLFSILVSQCPWNFSYVINPAAYLDVRIKYNFKSYHTNNESVTIIACDIIKKDAEIILIENVRYDAIITGINNNAFLAYSLFLHVSIPRCLFLVRYCNVCLTDHTEKQFTKHDSCCLSFLTGAHNFRPTEVQNSKKESISKTKSQCEKEFFFFSFEV